MLRHHAALSALAAVFSLAAPAVASTKDAPQPASHGQDPVLAPKPASAEPPSEQQQAKGPAATKPVSKARPLAGYDKGFFIQSEDGNYKLKIGGRVNARLEVSGTESGDSAGPSKMAFSIPRPWIKIQGHFFRPSLFYRVFVDFGKGGVPELFDAYVDYKAVKDVLHIRVGQWRMPWTRQFINPIPWMSLQERSMLTRAFSVGRDIGVGVHNNYDGKVPRFEYVLAAFNGTGTNGQFQPKDGKLNLNSSSNVPARFSPLFVARTAYNLKGGTRYREFDLQGGGPRFSLGMGSRLRLDGDGGNGHLMFGGDAAIHAYGVSGMVEVLARYDQDGARWHELAHTRLGAMAQLGYMIKKRVNPVVRYGFLKEKTGDKHSVFGGFSVLPTRSHLFRLMAEGGVVLDDTGSVAQRSWLARQQVILDF
jgi:hypothetical protein